MSTGTTSSNNSSSSNKTTNLSSSPPTTTDATTPMPTAERVIKSKNIVYFKLLINDLFYFSHSMSTKFTFISI